MHAHRGYADVGLPSLSWMGRITTSANMKSFWAGMACMRLHAFHELMHACKVPRGMAAYTKRQRQHTCCRLSKLCTCLRSAASRAGPSPSPQPAPVRQSNNMCATVHLTCAQSPPKCRSGRAAGQRHEHLPAAREDRLQFWHPAF